MPRIVIVSQDAREVNIRTLLSCIPDSEVFKPIIANSCEGSRMIERYCPDLIIIDAISVDAFEWLEAMNQHRWAYFRPCIVLGASPVKEDILFRLLKWGCATYLPIPVASETFVTMVQSVLQGVYLISNDIQEPVASCPSRSLADSRGEHSTQSDDQEALVFPSLPIAPSPLPSFSAPIPLVQELRDSPVQEENEASSDPPSDKRESVASASTDNPPAAEERTVHSELQSGSCHDTGETLPNQPCEGRTHRRGAREEAQQIETFGEPSKQSQFEEKSAKVTYRQQRTFCGKSNCRRCLAKIGHGPYWYGFWTENGRTRTKYIGKNAPDVHVETDGTDDSQLVYRLQISYCSKARCRKCKRGGPGHGPYWYAYQEINGQTKRTYVGKHLPSGARIAPPRVNVEKEQRVVCP